MKKTFCVLIASLISACAIVGGAPDLERASGYKVAPPEGWKSRSRGDSDRAYALPSGNVVTLVSSCHRNSDAPLDVLTRHLLMGTRDVKVKKTGKATFGKNEGLHSFVNAKLEGQPFFLEIFVLSSRDCVFDFSLLSPKEIPKEDSKAFQLFLASFKYGND